MSPDSLRGYIDHIEQYLLQLSNIYIEQFNATLLTTDRANLKLRIRFKGRYLLAVSEASQILNGQVTQIDYRYHFQDENNQVIFRYDSTPHFPNLPTFPHHKHLPDSVIATDQPSLIQVFQEAITIAEAKV